MPAPETNPLHPPIAVLNARYRAPLLSFFLRRVRSLPEAEDLTQEVFVRIVRQQGGSSLDVGDSLIFTIAANLLRDYVRRQRVRRSVLHLSLQEPEDSWSSAEAGHAPVEEIDPERVLLSQESLSRLIGALNRLKPRTRDIFLMYRLEGMKQRDIAEVFGISVSAVEKHIVQALAYLVASLG